MITDKSIAYAGSWYPHHIASDIEEIKAAGCTSITLAVNETDWNIFARARKMAVQTALDQGLKTFIDLQGFGLFPSYQLGSDYLIRNPDKRQIYSDGRIAATACPNDPAFLSWLKLTTFELIEYFGASGTFWDEPAFQATKEFPRVWACRCKHCKASYYDQYMTEMPMRLTDEVLQFRQDSLVRFATELISNSKSAGSQLDFLCLVSWDRAPEKAMLDHAWYGILDWEPFVQIPGLDVFSTDPYWIRPDMNWDFFVGNASEAVRIAKKHGRQSQLWVQVVWVPGGREADIARTAEKVQELGADMIAAWSYKAEPGSETFMAQNPDLAWKTVTEAFQKI